MVPSLEPIDETQSSRPESNETVAKFRDNLECGGKSWIIQKFGGTSIGKFGSNIAENIVRPGLKYNKIAVVCSARSTGKKIEGTTSRLLEVFNLLQTANTIRDQFSVNYQTIVRNYESLVCLICEDHISAAERDVRDAGIRANLIKEIKSECNELIDYRIAAERWHLEIDERTKDRMVSFGEKLSCRFVVAMLKDREVDAEFVDLADIIHFKGSKPPSQVFFQNLATVIRERILACENRVPVVSGYFGPVPGSLMNGDIGRGYTDLCASLVAVGLKADELQIWKEVDGIFTADPSKVLTARLLPSITPSEAAELTFYGSEVIHHLTIDLVVNATPPIQIRIKNVKNPENNGTIVLPDKRLYNKPLSHSRSSSINSVRNIPKRPTAVTIKDKISVINVHSNKRSISHGFFAMVFSVLDKLSVSVDLIATSEVHVSLAIHSGSISVEDMQRVRLELEELGDVSILHHMAILSLVGAEMRNMVGIAGKMFTTLGDHNINIEMISQGASEINISCVIESHEATRAMNILHTNIFTFLE